MCWVEFILFCVYIGQNQSQEQVLSGTLALAPHPVVASFSDSSEYVVCPWSLLLSAAGGLSFQDHVSHIEAAPFKAPELLQGSNEEGQPDASQVGVVCHLSQGDTPNSLPSPSSEEERGCFQAFLPASH